MKTMRELFDTKVYFTRESLPIMSLTAINNNKDLDIIIFKSSELHLHIKDLYINKEIRESLESLLKKDIWIFYSNTSAYTYMRKLKNKKVK